ncbi:MAG: BON domain-containing protein [Gammaproteobacteria bacterium]
MKHATKFSSVIGLVGVLSGPAWAAETHTAGEILDDTVVTTKVKAKLVADPVTKAHQISVETFEGTVKLSGFVDTPAAEQRAIEIARGIKGVTAVEDNLDVR